MYYRVAMQKHTSSPWQWKSTALSSLDALFQWLRIYSSLPLDRLHVFSARSREEINELLARENNGLHSSSITAAQFLQERGICSHEDGTINYLNLPAVEIGLKHLTMTGMATIHERITCLTGWLLDTLQSLYHGNGIPC